MSVSDFDMQSIPAGRDIFLLIWLSKDRMPPQIGEFISQHVYNGELKSYSGHPVHSSTVACRFVDVHGLEQLDDDGKSSFVSCY
ncbi:hypothetical protein BJV74DRAFT_624857 [Russula compacta]|nr:hypothetical protein BJV74DRAFT_624857 [Russula compacta]